MEIAIAPLTVVDVPLELIDPSPVNPRHVITEDMVEALAQSLKLEGQKTPAKVRPQGNGRYEVFAGHIRRRAALKVGLPTLKCLILDITPEQAFLEAVLDNRGQPMAWLDDYLVVEKMTEMFPKMRQEEMAARLGVVQQTVSRAKSIVKLLNQASRDLIYAQSVKSDSYQVTQRVVLALSRLATGSPDDQARMEAALRMVIDRQLKEKDAKRLAEWVKAGNKPEAFGQKEPKDAPEDPLKAQWGQLGPAFKVKYKGGEAYQLVVNLQGRNQTWNVASAASKALESQGSPSPLPYPVTVANPAATPGLHAQIGSWVAGGVLAKKIKLPFGSFERLFPSFTRLFHRVIGLFQWIGVKNRVAATILALFLVLTVGSSLISRANRLLEWLVSSWAFSSPKVSTPSPNLSGVAAPSLGGGLAKPEAPKAGSVVQGPNPNPLVSNPVNPSDSKSVPAAPAVTGSVAPASNSVASAQVPQKPETKDSAQAPASKSGQVIETKKGKDLPSEASAKEDPLKAVGDGLKDVSHAVGTVDEGVNAVDQAKKLLGF